MVDLTVSDILLIAQNIGNPAVFFPIIVFLTGYLSVKLGFGRERNWVGLDRYLAAFGIGFGMQSLSLLLSIIIGGLLLLQGYNFNSVFSSVLLVSSIITLLSVLYPRMEAGVPLEETYRKLVSAFWQAEMINLVVVSAIPFIIYGFYPVYLSELILPGWIGASTLILLMTSPLALVFFYLTRWFLLPPTKQIPLSPMGRPKRGQDVTVAVLSHGIQSRRRQLLVPVMLIVLILGLVAFDTNYAVFTPKMHFGDVNEDRYFYHYLYAYPYDYYLVLNPDNDGRLVGTTYALYNTTYTVTPAMLLALESCVMYDNPAGPSYLLSMPSDNYVSSSYSSGYVMQPSHFSMNKLGADSRSLVSIGNSTNTLKIQQCSRGVVHFSYWKKIDLTSVSVVDNCVVQRYTQARTDNISITTHDSFRVFLGTMTLIYSYNGTTNHPVTATVTMNGHNVTDGTAVYGPFLGPVVIAEPYPNIYNPFNSTLTIGLYYNSTYVPACPES